MALLFVSLMAVIVTSDPGDGGRGRPSPTPKPVTTPSWCPSGYVKQSECRDRRCQWTRGHPDCEGARCTGSCKVKVVEELCTATNYEECIEDDECRWQKTRTECDGPLSRCPGACGVKPSTQCTETSHNECHADPECVWKLSHVDCEGTDCAGTCYKDKFCGTWESHDICNQFDGLCTWRKTFPDCDGFINCPGTCHVTQNFICEECGQFCISNDDRSGRCNLSDICITDRNRLNFEMCLSDNKHTSKKHMARAVKTWATLDECTRIGGFWIAFDPEEKFCLLQDQNFKCSNYNVQRWCNVLPGCRWKSGNNAGCKGRYANFN